MKLHFGLSIFVLTTAILTAGSSRAATISVSGSVSSLGGLSFSVNQFNTSLGTLNSVTILQNTSAFGTLAFENTSTAQKLVNYVLSTRVSLLDAITVTPLVANISLIPTNGILVDAFDGILDYGGSSGRTIQSSFVNASPVTALVDSASIGLFQGNGLVTLRTQILRSAVVGAVPNGQLLGATQVNVNENANYTITYDFTPTLVPEPSTVLGMSLSGAFGLAFYRKKRSKSLV
jgi:PEP-CTERM motif